MGETAKKDKSAKKDKNEKKFSFSEIWSNLKGEFKKIIWPNQEQLKKDTTTVVVITAILCLIISLLDSVITTGIGFLIG